MDAVAKSAFCCREMGGEPGKSQTEEGELRPCLPKEACGPGPALLGSGKGVFSAPSSHLHPPWQRQAGPRALQTGRGTDDCFLELTMRLPISSLHWHLAQAAPGPGPQRPALKQRGRGRYSVLETGAPQQGS